MNAKYALLGIFLIIIGIISYIYWKVDDVQQRAKLSSYVSMLAIVGTFVLLLSFIESSQNNERITRKDLVEKNVQNDQKGIIELERLFIDQGPQLRRLYKQIHPNNQFLQQLPDPVITPEIIEKEQHAMSIMLQNVESILYPITFGILKYNTKEFQPWITTFKYWFSSELLREYWNINKSMYTIGTQNFIDTQILGQ